MKAITVHNTFNLGTKSLISYLCAEHIALVIVKTLHQARVVPASNDIIWAIMNLNLNGVPSVVDQKDDGIELVPDHA